MDLLSPSGHREALEPHSLNSIQSMFVSLGGIGSSGEGSQCILSLLDKQQSKRENKNLFNHNLTTITFSNIGHT